MKPAAGSTQLRFVKRTVAGHGGDDILIKLLQARHFEKLGTYHDGVWSDWADVPLVEPEDEDDDDD